jgi:S-DNA-T family DNA segregation ATPase FtsK/SpoIIIE
VRLTITTVDTADGRPRDHLLDLPDTCTVGQLASAVDTADRGVPATAGRASSGQPTGGDLDAFLDRSGPAGATTRTLWLDGTALEPGKPVRDSGIRSGSVLGLGGPAPEPLAIRPGEPRSSEPIMAEVHVVSGPGAGRAWRLTVGSYEIGTDARCAIEIAGADAPSGGLWLTVATDGTGYWHRSAGVDWIVRPSQVAPPPDAGPLLNPAVASTRDRAEIQVTDGSVPTGATVWLVDDDLAVGAVLLRLVAPVEPDAAVTQSADGTGLDYNRPPRIAPHLDAERVRLPVPPSPPGRQPFPLLIMLAPVVLGLVMVGVFHSLFYLVFVLFTPVMAVSNWISGRRTNRRSDREARERYRLRMLALEGEIETAVARERWVRNVTAPDPATLALVATGPGGRLWERRRRDPDHLLLRLGTVDLPSVKVVDDPARDENHRSIRWNIPDVPIGLELPEYGVIGVAGPAAAVQSLARWTTIQAAVLHSPRDVRIVVLTDPSRAAGWGWLQWLPHLRPASSAGPVASIGNDPESVANRVTELVAQIQARQRALGSSMGRAMFTDPDLLVIADGARQLRDVPGMVQVLTDGPSVRVFSLCLDQQERLLPEECGAVVVASGTQLTVRRSGTPDIVGVRADLVDPGWCDRVARRLTPMRDVSPENDSGLPHEVRLLNLLDQEPPDPRKLVARWRKRPASTSFLLGTGYDGPLGLDLVRDGPHGLVAGTTGSGKSELLQALVASLAVANRPDELTFVLVDYKGGSAFRECANLPHTLGMVTDLDAHLVQRALDSLGAELRRREQILATAEAKDHPSYQAKRAVDPDLPRLPRLLLVIDEFATLVREVPDFVPGLISIAQRGRSLGLHLILATQRPAGAVTPDIKANTNLRIALRVTDAVESQDIIDTSEAVHISPTTPGRALVRFSYRSAVPFQSAWVGAERPGDPAAGVPRATLRAAELSWGRLGRPPALPVVEQDGPAALAPAPTDLQELVEAVRAAAEQLDDFEPQPSPWLPALEERVLLDDLPPVDAGAIPYALEDVPQLQQRRVAAVDLRTFGHLYVIGAPRSGRTQVLRTIAGSAARTRSVADMHIYGIDAAGGGLAAVERLPHCGAIVSRYDIERLERLVGRLGRELTARQEACAARSCAGLVELRRLLPAGQRPAHLLLLIDGWDALVPILDDYDNGRLFTDITRLLREGAAAGIHVIATSERSLLGGRLAAHNDHKLLLRQTDRADYQLVGIAPGKVPTTVPAGRGWHALSRTETQVALLAPEDRGQEQADALRRIGVEAARRDTSVPASRRPFPVASMPGRVDFAEAYAKVPAELRRPMWGLLGVGGDDAAALGTDFAGAAPSFVVAGPSGSGRSNALACLSVSLLAGGASLVVLTPRDSPLRGLAQHGQVRLVTDPDPSAEAVQAALDDLSGPRVVVIDDADLLTMPAADRVLKEIAVSGRDRGLGLAFAGQADALSMAMGSWLTAAKRSRRGLLLAPRGIPEGDLIGVRLSSSQVRTVLPTGRGWTTGTGGVAAAVQVPLTVLKSV